MKLIWTAEMLRKRLENTISQFYDDLEIYCGKMKWRYTKPTHSKLHWDNNMVMVQCKNRTGTPLEFEVTYKLPSLNVAKKVTYEHVYRITLPKSYPQDLGQVRIMNTSGMHHPRNFGHYMCLTVNGEMDRILMNLFNQTIWVHSEIFPKHSDSGSSISVNLKKTETLIAKEMNKMHGINQKPRKEKKRMRILD
jgi:hypothetical protein